MKDRPGNQASAIKPRKEPGLDGRHRDAGGGIRQKHGDTLGLSAFEKISAVEGLRLSVSMREDLKSLDAQQMDESQRSRFINEKYGKK